MALDKTHDKDSYPEYMLGSRPLELIENPEKSVAPWIGEDGMLETVAAERVKAWWERA